MKVAAHDTNRPSTAACVLWEERVNKMYEERNGAQTDAVTSLRRDRDSEMSGSRWPLSMGLSNTCARIANLTEMLFRLGVDYPVLG